MCGIWGYAGAGAPDPTMLAAVAAAAGRRGPHAHGWASTGDLAGYRHHALGPAPCGACHLERATSPRVLGHSRLATFGHPDNLDGAQPFTIAGHTLAHNGNAYNAAELDPAGALVSDSYALLVVYADLRDRGLPPIAAFDEVLARADMGAYALVVLDRTGELLVHHHGLPLHELVVVDQLYLSSVSFPGSSPVPADATLRKAPAL